MFKLFGGGRFLEADIEDWVLETWAWLLTEFGGMERLRRSPLVLPTREFFPLTETEGHARALYLFDRVKLMTGLRDWPCELEAFDRPRGAQVAQVGAIRHGGSANGTFRTTDNRAIISYTSDLTGCRLPRVRRLQREYRFRVRPARRRLQPGLGGLAQRLSVRTQLGFRARALLHAQGC